MKKGAELILMPYTPRTLARILSRFSTGHEPTPKNAYTANLLSELLDMSGEFEVTMTHGFNYWGYSEGLLRDFNTDPQKNKSLLEDLSYDLLVFEEFRNRLIMFETYSGMWEARLKALQEIIGEFIGKAKIPTTVTPSKTCGIGVEDIKRDASLSETIDPSNARFMLVKAV